MVTCLNSFHDSQPYRLYLRVLSLNARHPLYIILFYENKTWFLLAISLWALKNRCQRFGEMGMLNHINTEAVTRMHSKGVCQEEKKIYYQWFICCVILLMYHFKKWQNYRDGWQESGFQGVGALGSILLLKDNTGKFLWGDALGLFLSLDSGDHYSNTYVC